MEKRPKPVAQARQRALVVIGKILAVTTFITRKSYHLLKRMSIAFLWDCKLYFGRKTYKFPQTGINSQFSLFSFEA